MRKKSYYIINIITLYRLIMAPVLLFIIFTGNLNLFKWLLPLSFFTDLIDGYLARKFRVTSTWGAKLDSIADDVNILVAVIALFVFKFEFIIQEKASIIVLLVLFAVQTALALIRYKKISSFHTYLAKCAAMLQGVFLILVFLIPGPVYFLFYAMVIVTAIELSEEIILVLLLPKWQANVKGIYWVLQKKTNPV
ncbi:MAG: CDP-alcohol phosphatidyltransferase family protein [Bacteroidota bacterium]|nr:CDP-alcohol phosphatidyltransferase family protein [Bacteroidota bacterium]